MTGRKKITPELVTATATALANEHGFAAVTLASVAAQLEIRVPSLYNHVDGLAGLHREMISWGLRTLVNDLRDAVIGKAGDDAIRSLAHAYRGFALSNPGVYGAILRANDIDHPEITAAKATFLTIVLAVLAAYQLSDDEALHAVRGMRALMHGFVDLEVLGGFGMPLSVDESFQRMVELFIKGLKGRQ